MNYTQYKAPYICSVSFSLLSAKENYYNSSPFLQQTGIFLNAVCPLFEGKLNKFYWYACKICYFFCMQKTVELSKFKINAFLEVKKYVSSCDWVTGFVHSFNLKLLNI